jgi:hypothetical protein
LKLQFSTGPMSVRSFNSFFVFFLSCIKAGA